MKTPLASLVLFPIFCFAQSAMYKCGNTYSETSCGPDAKVMQAPKTPVVARVLIDKPPLDAVIADNSAKCEKQARAQMKDPFAAQIGPVLRGGLAVQYQDGRTYNGVNYFLDINGKNSYGAFTGARLWVCVFDEAETALLRVREIGPVPR